MNKSNGKAILIGGLTPAVIISLTYIAIFYPWWVALLVFLVPFVVVNGLFLYADYRGWLKNNDS